jgi:hypothetical protein
MGKQLLLILSLSVTVSILALPSLKLTFEQNMDAGASNITTAANMANVTPPGDATDTGMTGSDNTTSSARTYLEEIIKALQASDNEGAKTLITGAQAGMSNAPIDARKQFEIGLRVLDGGDISEAIKYFEAANQTLG